MAYTRQKEPACPVLGDPGVVSAYVPITTAESNVPIKVPWDGCKLVYAYGVYTHTEAAAAQGPGVCELDLEINYGNGNTTVSAMDISIASSAAVGSVTEASYSSAEAGEAACENLNNSDTVMIEMDGAAGTTSYGGVMVYLYFEPNSF